MKRILLKRVFPQALVWAALAALCGAVALAQNSTAAPAAGVRSDGQIEMDVVHDLDASQALKQDMITAATIQGEVTLSGTASSEASRELAESISAHVVGVSKVQNNLKIGNPQAGQDASVADAGSDPAADNQADSQPAPSATDGPMNVPDQSQAQSPVQAPGRARPHYMPARPLAPVYAEAKGPVTIPQGTLLQLRTNESVGSKSAKQGTPVQFTVIQDVAVGGVLALPRGATVHGVVFETKQPGVAKGSSELSLKLTSLDLGGQSYPLDSGLFKVKGPGKGGRTAASAFGGALLGAMIGGIAGGGEGAAIGAGAGGVGGAAASAATPGAGVWIPAEALVEFHLNTPLTVTPVNAQEASRLAQGLYQGGPSLYQRGYGPGPAPYANVYYSYPPVYYRPYYVEGGYYYWR